MAVDGLKKSECTLCEMLLPILVVCDACSCASLQTSACVLVLAQQQAAVRYDRQRRGGRSRHPRACRGSTDERSMRYLRFRTITDRAEASHACSRPTGFVVKKRRSASRGVIASPSIIYQSASRSSVYCKVRYTAVHGGDW